MGSCRSVCISHTSTESNYLLCVFWIAFFLSRIPPTFWFFTFWHTFTNESSWLQCVWTNLVPLLIPTPPHPSLHIPHLKCWSGLHHYKGPNYIVSSFAALPHPPLALHFSTPTFIIACHLSHCLFYAHPPYSVWFV